MITTIPVKRMFRIINNEIPVGNIILEPDLEQTLSDSVGEYVVDLRTMEKVYIFNRDKWRWEKSIFLSTIKKVV